MSTESIFHPKYIPSWISVFILRLLALLPYTIMMRISEPLGRLLNKTLKRRHIIAQTNIDLCFPEKTPVERQALTEQAMISMVKGLFETLLAWWAPDKFFQAHCRYEGTELVLNEQNKGRGVILIGAHYSTLDLSGRTLSRKLKVGVTYKKQRNKVFDELIKNNREKRFSHVIEKQAMRAMIKTLKQGHCIWYAPDLDFGRKGTVFAPFFHTPASSLATIGKLVKVSKAKVLYYEHLRLEENGQTVYCARIYDPFNDDFNEDDVHNATLINKAIADSIRQQPDQYFWHHERFRTRPNRDDPKIYPRKKKKHKKARSH